ncbi:MAG: hypothetical protein K6G82_03345 [Ruminococcus sp.]|nr:hypothetical protein [Ruminococcus sp.]
MDFLDIDFGSVIKSGFDYVMYNFVHKALYTIEILVCQFIDWLQQLFGIFSGTATVKYGDDDPYLIEVFFNNSAIAGVFRGMAAIGITFAFMFSIIAVIRKLFDVDDKMKSTYGQILRSLFRSILIILCLHFSMTVVVAFTNVLMTSVTKAFDDGEDNTLKPHIDFTDEQFAAMARIFNTVGNYSLNPSYKNRYNLNTCYNEIRGDLRYLADTGVFDFYYETVDSNGKTVNTWQSVLQDIAAAANYNTEAPVDVYNEAIANSLSNCMTVMKTDPSFHALKSYDRTYKFKNEDVDLGRVVFLIGTMGIGKTAAARNEAFNKTPKFTDNCRLPYYYGIKDAYDLDQVNQDFDISYEKTNYIVVFFSCFVLIINMGIIIVSCIVRIFNLLFLYIIAPPIIGIMPMDDGQKFKQWVTAFIIQAFSVFATVISMRLFLIFVPVIMSPNLQLSENIYLDMLGKLIAIWAGVIAVQRANGLLTGILADSAGQQSLFAGDVGNDVRGKMMGMAQGALGLGAAAGKLGLKGAWKVGKGTVKTGWRGLVGASDDDGRRGIAGTLRNKGLLGGLYEGSKSTASWAGEKLGGLGSGGDSTKNINEGASESFLKSNSGNGQSASSLIGSGGGSGNGSGNGSGGLKNPPPSRKGGQGGGQGSGQNGPQKGNLGTQMLGAALTGVANTVNAAGQLAGETVNTVTGTNAGDLIKNPTQALADGANKADEAMNGPQNKNDQQGGTQNNTNLPNRSNVSQQGSAQNNTNLPNRSNLSQQGSGSGSSSSGSTSSSGSGAGDGGDSNAAEFGRGVATVAGYALQGIGAVTSFAGELGGGIVEAGTEFAGDAINEVTGTELGNVVKGAGTLAGGTTKGVTGVVGGAESWAGKGLRSLGTKSEDGDKDSNSGNKPLSAPPSLNPPKSNTQNPPSSALSTTSNTQNTNPPSNSQGNLPQPQSGVGSIVDTAANLAANVMGTSSVSESGPALSGQQDENQQDSGQSPLGVVGDVLNAGVNLAANAMGLPTQQGGVQSSATDQQGSEQTSETQPASGENMQVPPRRGSVNTNQSRIPSMSSNTNQSRTPSTNANTIQNRPAANTAPTNQSGTAQPPKPAQQGQTTPQQTNNTRPPINPLNSAQDEATDQKLPNQGGGVIPENENVVPNYSSSSGGSGGSSDSDDKNGDENSKGFWSKLGDKADGAVTTTASVGVSAVEGIGSTIEEFGDWLFDVHDDNRGSSSSVPMNNQPMFNKLDDKKDDDEDDDDDSFGDYTPPQYGSTTTSESSNDTNQPSTPNTTPLSSPPPLTRPSVDPKSNSGNSILNDLANNVSNDPPRNQNTNRKN